MCISVCVSERKGEAVTEALATFLKKRVRKRQRSRRSQLCSSSVSPGSGTERSHFPSSPGWHISTTAALPPSCLYLFCTQIHNHRYREYLSAHKYTRNPLGHMHEYAYLCHSCRYYTNTHKAHSSGASVCGRHYIHVHTCKRAHT